MRQLTLLQRQRLTLSLFFAVAMGAVVTVAAPAFVPWQVVDEKREQALEQQRRQGIDYHVVPNPRRRGNSSGGSSPLDQQGQVESKHASPLPLSAFSGALLQQNRIPLTSPSDVELARKQLETGQGTTTTTTTVDVSDSNRTGSDSTQENVGDEAKRKRRRRRRKKVSEGWQELTGRTAREEKAKAEAAHAAGGSSTTDQDTSSPERIFGENGGQEIEWKNKSRQSSEPVS